MTTPIRRQNIRHFALQLGLLAAAVVLACVSSARAAPQPPYCAANETPAAIDIEEGNFNPPAYIVPDVQETVPSDQPPVRSGLVKEYATNVGLVQWHQLQSHIQPLTVTCHYLVHQDTSYVLPPGINTCSWDGQAHTFLCQ